MNKYIRPLILLILVLSLVLSACTRSATKNAADLTDATPDIPFPVGPDNNLGRITEIIAVTQTSQALNPSPGEATADSKDVPPTKEQPVVVDTEVPEPTATVLVVPTATPGLPATYTVQDGEFPYCLARRFNINPNDLISVNNITGLVSPGTTLTIPSNSTWPAEFPRALIAHPATYNVVSGDTIYKIACHFGDVDPNAIILANGLVEPYTLTPGQVLQIP
jgi:LysM repeat protein